MASERLKTKRLVLRHMAAQDAGFILRLLNEPSFLHYIGDKGVRSLTDAGQYIKSGPAASYAQYGFGLYLVELKGSGDPVGMCGLIKRDTLEDVDLGFALLPEYWSQGYASESAQAVLHEGWHRYGLPRIVAVTASDNAMSMALLQRLGFRYIKNVTLFEGNEEIRLYRLDNPAAST